MWLAEGLATHPELPCAGVVRIKQQLPVFPHLAISEDTEEEEEDEDQDYSFPISSILEW